MAHWGQAHDAAAHPGHPEEKLAIHPITLAVLAGAMRENATLATFDTRFAAAAAEAGVPVAGASPA